MQKFTLVCCLALMCFFLVGCGGKFTSEEFVRENIDLSSISKIAVLPFKNNTVEKFEGERIRNIVLTQILSLGIADAVDQGIIDSIMAEEVIDARSPIDVISLKRLSQRLGAQAFIMGSVDASEGHSRSGQGYPKLALTLRLVEGQSGTIIWQSSGIWNTETIAGRLFGGAPTDKFKVALKLVRKMLIGLAQ